MKWLITQNGVHLCWRLFAKACESGYMEIIRWLRREGCPLSVGACYCAAGNGHLEILKWLRSEGCPWNAGYCAGAAEGGHLEILKWLRSEGCPWDEEECRTVGKPNIVRWIEAQSSSL